MTKFNQTEINDRRELLGLITSIAHSSDEFYDKLLTLVKEYSPTVTDKIGYGEVSNFNKN